MKIIKQTVLKAAAKLGMKTAIDACGSASYFLCYQPKEPASLKKYVKK